MKPAAILERLGTSRAGLRLLESARGSLAVREDLAQRMLASGLGPDDAPRLTPLDLVGKRNLEGIEGAGDAFVVRRYRHGGLLRWLTGSRFRSPERPFVELCLQRELARAGIRSPEVVAARAVRSRPWGWSLAVVTLRVHDALDLGQALAQQQAGQLDLAQSRALLREAGRCVARMHAAGFLHADLTPRNLLVERAALRDERPDLWVLDLDRSRWVPELSDELRWENLARLARHVERLGRERGLAVGRTDRMRFLCGWCPERGPRRRAWRAIAERGRSGGALHAVGWLLERRLGRGRSGAERHLGTLRS
jgi:Lipopolysaccharide kinase (Kdo/WaaP) family